MSTELNDPDKKLSESARAALARDVAADSAAQDIEGLAYTTLHAIGCTVTDFIDPWVGHLTQQWFNQRVSIGCGHDHSADGHAHHHHHHHDHDHSHHHDHSHDHKPSQSHLSTWVIAEVTGDFAAVPITVACQRLAPGMMNGLRNVMEPALGPFFHYGARRGAASWAHEHGFAADSPEAKEKERQIYDHEARHLPQAAIWTVSSIAVNLAMHRVLGNTAPLWQLAAGKAMGSSISAGLVVGGRSMFPDTAQRWDDYATRKIFVPAAKKVGGVFGIDPEAVERAADRHARMEGHGDDEAPGSTVSNVQACPEQACAKNRAAVSGV